jgi:hypothetical protein
MVKKKSVSGLGKMTFVTKFTASGVKCVRKEKVGFSLMGHAGPDGSCQTIWVMPDQMGCQSYQECGFFLLKALMTPRNAGYQYSVPVLVPVTRNS